ncbi:hypothetical protein WAI453_012344 [Rhynchosporium graminicola]
MSSSKNHPLPTPPGQQRPRAQSHFSFRSTHSRQSSSGSQKIDLHESHQEKESKRLTTKADPQMALNEAEPHGRKRKGITSTHTSHSTQRQPGKSNCRSGSIKSYPKSMGKTFRYYSSLRSSY